MKKLLQPILALLIPLLIALASIYIVRGQTQSAAYLPLVSRDSQATALPPSATPTDTVTPPPANAFYVAATGNDDNPGSLEQPWRTIQRAADNVGPGSLVYVRGGVYAERVTLNVSGAAGLPITFQSYPGETAILDADGLAFSEDAPALWLIFGQSYVVIRDFELRNYRTSAPDQVPFGVAIFGASHHIELRDNRIHHIEHNGTDPNSTDAHGIAAYGESGAQSIHDIVIDGNELYNLKLGSSEALAINGNVENWQVTNNRVHDVNNIGIAAIGFENTAPANDWARDGLIAGNEVYNINSAGNIAYGSARSAGCIYVDGGRRITIERNLAHHCNIGIEVASEHAGGFAGEIVVRNNFIHSNSDVGLALGGYSEEVGGAYGCSIVNNTFYNNTTHPEAWGGELTIQYDTQNSIIQNNIFFADSDGGFLQSWSAVMSGNQVDYNLFYAPGGGTNGHWEWQGIAYNTFAAYQAGSGNDAHSLAAENPLLVSTAAPDLHIQPASPAKERGLVLPACGTLDFDGEPRLQNGIDIGADEIQPGE